MKVAFCIRDTYLTEHGGDVTQMLKTKTYLENTHGIQIEILTNPEDLDKSFDIAHVFNFSTVECSQKFVLKAKKEGIKIAFSTIYWDYSYVPISRILKFFRFNLTPLTAQICILACKAVALVLQRPMLLSNRFRKHIRLIVELSDVLLPNSVEEAEKFIDFAKPNKDKTIIKTHVVPNATDFTDVEESKDICTLYKIPKNYILQVGRIEFIKGQLQTIKALEKNPEIPIVFVGRIVEQDYWKQVENRAKKRGNVFFIPEVPHSDVQHFYKSASLHILPSLRESPGLVSLEALSNGCKIVVANKNFTPCDTYFKDIASICNPLSVKNIRKNILQEIKMNRNTSQIKEVVKAKFSWEAAAKETYMAYCRIFENQNKKTKTT